MGNLRAENEDLKQEVVEKQLRVETLEKLVAEFKAKLERQHSELMILQQNNGRFVDYLTCIYSTRLLRT